MTRRSLRIQTTSALVLIILTVAVHVGMLGTPMSRMLGYSSFVVFSLVVGWLAALAWKTTDCVDMREPGFLPYFGVCSVAMYAVSVLYHLWYYSSGEMFRLTGWFTLGASVGLICMQAVVLLFIVEPNMIEVTDLPATG